MSAKYLTTTYDDDPAAVAQPAPAVAAPDQPFVSTTLSTRKPWPMGLTVICCFFGLISLLGMFSALSTMTTLYLAPPTEADLSHMGKDAKSRRLKRQIREMEAKALATQKKYLPILTYLELLKLGIAASLAISVGLMVGRNPKARRFALVTCGVAIFYHLSAVGAASLISTEILGPIASMFESNIAAADPSMSKAEQAEAAQSFSRVVTGVLVIVIAIYLLIKLVFYGVIMAYLNRVEIKEIFEPTPPPELPEAEGEEVQDAAAMA